MSAEMFITTNTILGVGMDYKLYYRESMDKPWVKAPDKGGKVFSVAITFEGKILGVGMNNKLYFRDSFDEPWVKAPNDNGSLKGVAVTRDGTILGIGMDNKIWTRKLQNFAKNPWVKAPDKGGWIKGIHVYNNDRIVAVGSDNNLFTRANLNSPWKSTKKHGQVTDICVLKDRTVVGIGMNKKLWTRSPNLTQLWKNTPDKGGLVLAIASHPWRDASVPAPIGEAADPVDDVEETELEDADKAELDVPAKSKLFVTDNCILGVGMDYKLYYRETMQDSWIKAPDVGGQVSNVAITAEGKILGVGLNNSLYYRESLDAKWVKMPNDAGKLKGVAVTKEGLILGIGMDNKIWTRSLNNFAKTNWVKAPDMGGWIKDIAVYNNGRILAVGRNNKLFTRANLQSKWKATPNKGGQVTGCCALKDRTVVGIGMNKKLFTRGPTLNDAWATTPDKGGQVMAITCHPWRNFKVQVDPAAAEATPVPEPTEPVPDPAEPVLDPVEPPATNPIIVPEEKPTPVIVTEENVDEGENVPEGEGADPLDDVEETELEDADDEELDESQYAPPPNEAPKLKKVLEDAEEDLKNSEFTWLPGKILNPVTDLVVVPVAEKASEILPAIAGAMPLPFVDDVSSAILGASFGAVKIGYTLFPFSADDDNEREASGLFDGDLAQNFKNRPRAPKPFLSTVMSGVGFASNSALDLMRLPFSGDLGKWLDTTKKFWGYMVTSGVGEEVLDGFLSPGAVDAIMIIAKIQDEFNELGTNTRRIRTGLTSLPPGINDKADFKTIMFDAQIYGKYSSAAYGVSMIDSSEFLNVQGHSLNVPLVANVSMDKRKRKMSRFLGIPPEDIIDPTSPGGDFDVIGHFFAVDKRKSAIVFALRGTYTISGLKTDAAAYSRDFCNGKAHCGIADRTDKIWDLAKDKLVELLKANPDFDLVITGHSLGAGTAALLALKMTHEKLLAGMDPALDSVTVKCFAFAPPAVYLADPEHETVMAESMKYIYSFMHETDVVPFASMHALRCCVDLIDNVDAKTGLIEGPLIAMGLKPIPESLKEEVMKASELDFAPEAERLAIPSPYVTWMRVVDTDKDGNAVYNAMFVRPKMEDGKKGVNDLQIHLDKNLIADHMNPMYEKGIASIVNQMKGIDGSDGYVLAPAE